MLKTEKNEIKNKSKNDENQKIKPQNRLKEITEAFNGYKRTVYKLIILYVLVYFTWVIVGLFVLPNLFWNKTQLDNMEKFKFGLLIANVSLLFGLLFCADGLVSAMIKTPFNNVTFEINSSNLSKKEKTDLLFWITVSNECLRETFKKFGLLSLIVEMKKAFINGTPLNKYYQVELGNRPNTTDTGLYLLTLFAYCVPIFLAIYFIYHIENKIKATSKKIDQNKLTDVKKINVKDEL